MANAAMMPAEGSRLHSLTEQDVRDVLRHHNPGVAPSRVQAMAAILAVAADVLAELPDARRRELARAKGKFREALVRAAAENTDIGEDRLRLDSAGPVEWRRGSGLGKRISLEEGQAQLDRYAEAMPLESWAGPVAGAGEIERHLGIPRSTLSHWQQRGVIVGLLRGERKLAYPLEQFVDGRPIEGIADVIGIAPDARSAWLWLRQSHAALDGQAPLAALRRVGGRDEVVQAAKRDFV